MLEEKENRRELPHYEDNQIFYQKYKEKQRENESFNKPYLKSVELRLRDMILRGRLRCKSFQKAFGLFQ